MYYKTVSSLLAKALTVMKTGLEKHCIMKTSHTGVNNMWMLKNSTNLMMSLAHLGVRKATSIQTFDFFTLYTSIQHDLLKSRKNNTTNNAFEHKNGAAQYIICKRYHSETVVKESGLDNCSSSTGNTTYTSSCQMSSDMKTMSTIHDTFMKSLGIELSDDDKRLPYLYLISKLNLQ